MRTLGLVSTLHAANHAQAVLMPLIYIAVIDESPAVGLNFWDQKEFYKEGSDGVKRLAHHIDGKDHANCR